MKKDKLLQRAINNPGNIHFSEFGKLLKTHHFECVWSKGGHFQYYIEKYRQLLPVQEKNGMAKEYQVIQFLIILEEHDAI